MFDTQSRASDNTKADLDALCYINADKKGKAYISCGVLISPRRVLMTLHGAANASGLTFTAANGNKTTIKRKVDGGIHVFSKPLDLAVVELRQDMQGDFAQVNFSGSNNRNLFRNDRGYLGTVFNQEPKGHTVKFDTLRDALMKEKTSTYMASVRCRPGYSGSPIFGADGETVVSIVTHVDLNQQDRDERFGNAFNNAFGHNTGSLISVDGPSVNAFSEFMKKVNARTNFDPAGPKARL